MCMPCLGSIAGFGYLNLVKEFDKLIHKFTQACTHCETVNIMIIKYFHYVNYNYYSKHSILSVNVIIQYCMCVSACVCTCIQVYCHSLFENLAAVSFGVCMWRLAVTATCIACEHTCTCSNCTCMNVHIGRMFKRETMVVKRRERERGRMRVWLCV